MQFVFGSLFAMNAQSSGLLHVERGLSIGQAACRPSAFAQRECDGTRAGDGGSGTRKLQWACKEINQCAIGWVGGGRYLGWHGGTGNRIEGNKSAHARGPQQQKLEIEEF